MSKMTDEQIIKALECCISAESCCVCGYTKMCDGTTIHQFALDLINRQQAEIEKLTINMNAFGLGMKREKERADTIRAEAIKEFANEFEYEIIHKEFWNEHPHTSQVWLNGYEQCMRDIRVMLKDKLKEMVGDAGMSKRYVKCDGCGNDIYLGEIAFQYDGLCGIYCSPECFSDAFATTRVITEEEAENCGSEVFEEMVGEQE